MTACSDGLIVARGSERMQLTMLKAKVHRATVIHAEIDHQGSETMDMNLLEASGIREFKRVRVLSVRSGECIATDTVCTGDESGIGAVGGVAVHDAALDGLNVICWLARMNAKKEGGVLPKLICADAGNGVVGVGNHLPAQAA